MKKTLLLLLSSSVLIFHLQAEVNPPQREWKTTLTYGEKDESGKPFVVGFEFGNRGKAPVWIQVLNGADFSTVFQVAPTSKDAKYKTTQPLITDITKPTYLLIWKEDPRDSSGAMKNKTSNYTYTFTPNKTVYITWGDPSSDSILRPTKGRLSGLLGGYGKTETNLSLKKNISQKDIIEKAGVDAETILKGVGSSSK